LDAATMARYAYGGKRSCAPAWGGALCTKLTRVWIPASAGMTSFVESGDLYFNVTPT
jgi:hypothetical protein